MSGKNPPPPPPPKAPKAKKRTPRTASAKDVALAARIIDQLDPERMMPGPPITSAAASTLRRAQMTLRRWAELECGTDTGHIEREGGEDTGRPIFHPAGRWVGGRYVEPKPYAVPDRERGALARVAATCKALGLHFYHQTDPRGCALYVAAEPLTASDYSTKGIPCL